MRLLPIQITRWLTHVAVWRFVGFVSTFVGLLCYGLSSSFHYLIGEWSLLKIFLYGFFSLFICLCSLFAKVCQHSPSLLFKAHSSFLVLTITSVCSYFADKAVKGKPDAFSLVSCVAFVIMSFSLSRQTQFGFEVDLFYFVMGCLIVLFMKINLALAIVGVVFSYSLIILRYSLNTTSYENVPVQDEHSITIDVNSLSTATDNAGNSMMQQLMACMKAFEENNSNLTQMILERAKRVYPTVESEEAGLDHSLVIDALPSEKINELEETIKMMMGNGLEKECCDVYCNWRKESLKGCLINWSSLHGIYKIGWIKALNVTLRMLFPIERRLCDCVFSGFSSVADLCFSEVCQEAMVKLLNFADDYASMPLPLLSTLSMLEKLGDLTAEFQTWFPESLVNEVVTVRDKLGERCSGIFMKMEDDIFSNPYARLIVRPDVIYHPMTRCVIDYLEQNLKNFRKFSNVTGTSSVTDQVDRIMKRWERELLAVSKNYKHLVLRYLFIMNNWRYLERRTTELRYLGFFKNCAAIVQGNYELYQRSAWKMVRDFLKLEKDELVDAQSIRNKLINEHIEFVCRQPSTWLASKDLQSKQLLPIIVSPEDFTRITDDLEYYLILQRRRESILNEPSVTSGNNIETIQEMDVEENIFLRKNGQVSIYQRMTLSNRKSARKRRINSSTRDYV